MEITKEKDVLNEHYLLKKNRSKYLMYFLLIEKIREEFGDIVCKFVVLMLHKKSKKYKYKIFIQNLDLYSFGYNTGSFDYLWKSPTITKRFHHSISLNGDVMN